jgi:hypothetical protein
MLTLRGVALGAAMYVALAVFYIWVSVRAVQHPVGQVGWDFRSMAGPIIRNPMFYITFIVLATIGSAIVQVWKTR